MRNYFLKVLGLFVFNLVYLSASENGALFKSYLSVLMPPASYRNTKLEVTQTAGAAKIDPIIASLHVPSVRHQEEEGRSAVRVHRSQATGHPDPTCTPETEQICWKRKKLLLVQSCF